MRAPTVAVGPAAAPAFVRDAVASGGGVVVDDARGADAVVWTDPRDVAGLQRFLRGADGVEWVQLPWAGVEDFAAAGVFDDRRTWTSGKGVYAEPVAEHALALGIGCLRALPDYARATRWGSQAGTTLYGGRVTILGGGGITVALLRLLAPFRVETTVLRRAAEPCEGATRTRPIAALDDSLTGADLVVVALALTPATERIIARPQFEAMERHAVLVNVARGRHVFTDDLVAALHEGAIGGAGLDVTDPEPLPDGHPLWDAPNCVVTPHTGNTPEMARRPLAERIAENVRRFAAGEPLIGTVDPRAGY